MQKAHEYVSHWEEMKANSLGLLLWGDVGTGKSFSLAALQMPCWTKVFRF